MLYGIDKIVHSKKGENGGGMEETWEPCIHVDKGKKSLHILDPIK